jgi:ankyrin repeat protein
VLPLACAVGFGLDLHHTRHVCGLTLREGVRRADGSLDRAGFLGGAADMIKSAARIQAPWLAAARAKGREGYPPTQLMLAVVQGNEQRVRELVAAGAPLDLVDVGGWSALYWASLQGYVRIAKLLLDGKYEGKGADINLQVNGGCTPLMRACFYGHEAVVRLLLERGAIASLRDTSGSTALSLARRSKRAAIVALLGAHGTPE